MEEELYESLLITWYPGGEGSELHFGGARPSKEDYKKNLISYGKGAIYVMDPLNILHTATREIKLSSEEALCYKIDKIKRFFVLRRSITDIQNKKRSLFSLATFGVFESTLLGTLYKTTERLVYIQKTPPWYHPRFILNMPEWLRDTRLNKAKRMTGVSIPLNAIRDYEIRSRKRLILYLETNNAGYIVVIYPYTPKLLECLPKREG